MAETKQTKKKNPEQETKEITKGVAKTGLVATRDGIHNIMNQLLERPTNIKTAKSQPSIPQAPAPPKPYEAMQMVTKSLSSAPVVSASPISLFSINGENDDSNGGDEGEVTTKPNGKLASPQKPVSIDLVDDMEVEEKSSSTSVKKPTKNGSEPKAETPTQQTKGKANPERQTSLLKTVVDVEADGSEDDSADEHDHADSSDVGEDGNIKDLVDNSVEYIEEKNEEENDVDAMDIDTSDQPVKKKTKKLLSKEERARAERKALLKLRAKEREKEYELDTLIASKLENKGGRSKTAAIAIKSLTGSKAGGLKSALKHIHGKNIDLDKLERKELAKRDESNDDEDEALNNEEDEDNESGSSEDGDDAKSSESSEGSEDDEEVDLMDISDDDNAKATAAATTSDNGTSKSDKKGKKGGATRAEDEPENEREAEDRQAIKESLGEDKSRVKSEAPPASSLLLTFTDNDFASDDDKTSATKGGNGAENDHDPMEVDTLNAAEEADEDVVITNPDAPPKGGAPKTKALSDRDVITVDHEALCQETAAAVYSIMSGTRLMTNHFQSTTMAEVAAFIKGVDATIKSGPISPDSVSKVAQQLNPQITKYADSMRMNLGALLQRIQNVTKGVHEPWAARLNVVVLILMGDADIVENLRAAQEITCAFSGATIPKDGLFGMLLIHVSALNNTFTFPFAPTISSSMSWMRPNLKSTPVPADSASNRSSPNSVIDLTAPIAQSPALPPPREPSQNQEGDPEIARFIANELKTDVSRPSPTKKGDAPRVVALSNPAPVAVPNNSMEVEANEEDDFGAPAEAPQQAPKSVWELLKNDTLRLHSRYPERLALWIREVRDLAKKDDQRVASRINPNPKDPTAIPMSAPYFKGNGMPSVLGGYDETKPNHKWIDESVLHVIQTFFYVYDPKAPTKNFPTSTPINVKGLPFKVYARPDDIKTTTEIFAEVDSTVFPALVSYVFEKATLAQLETFQRPRLELMKIPIGRAAADDHPLKDIESVDFFPSDKPGHFHATRVRFFFRLVASLFVSKIVYYVNAKQ